MKRFNKRWVIIQLLLALISIMPATVSQAQEQIVITLAVDAFRRDLFREPIARFEAENPGIKVNIINPAQQTGGGVTDVDSLNTYLDDMETLVSSADVMMLDNSQISP